MWSRWKYLKQAFSGDFPFPILCMYICMYVFELKYNWPATTLCQSWVHNLVIQYFGTSQNHHHDKPSCPLSPYKVITMLSTVFSMLCISSPWLIYFVTGCLYHLTSLTYCSHPPTPDDSYQGLFWMTWFHEPGVWFRWKYFKQAFPDGSYQASLGTKAFVSCIKNKILSPTFRDSDTTGLEPRNIPF